ncbi:MAG: hypothetical protein H6743_03700 [Rickettsiaceae bacterium]|nr:hypothetical protein [Rickettsiaceae bacterium]
MFRVLKKKYYLPIKYYLIIRKKALSSKLRHQEDIYLKYEQIKNDLLIAQREDNKLEIEKQNAKLELINWILNK